MIIENYKGILDYEDFYIRIKTFIGIININGFNLRLNQLTDEAISVTGKIESVELESTTDEED
jgi:sporulation protein YqfC